MGRAARCAAARTALTGGCPQRFERPIARAPGPCILRAARALPPTARARMNTLPVVLRTVALLALSNVFMTFAWYGHLRTLGDRKWYVAAVASWGIAFFEYLLQVPANRMGYTVLTLSQLKIIQEVITLAVFVPFAVLYMRQPLKLDYLWAALCILGAVYFVFRSQGAAG